MTDNTPTNITYIDNIDENVGLPKWPGLVVSGQRVTTRQAAEILIRTDSSLPNFKYAGNDRQHAAKLMELFGMDYDDNEDDYQARWKAEDDLRDRLKVIPLNYLPNSQIVSAYIGGPHGWCDWNGNIFANSYNVGKWPSVEEVAEDWASIAEAFPFLDLTSHLYNAEACEDGKPVVEFIVKDGKVEVRPPQKLDLAPLVDDFSESVILDLFTNPNRECGITINALSAKLVEVYGEIPQYK